MSYSIHYGSTIPRKYASRQILFRNVCIMILIIFIVAFGYFFPQRLHIFVQTLFPWTRGDTQAAFSEFCEDVRAGDPISIAFAEFCGKIVKNAQ